MIRTKRKNIAFYIVIFLLFIGLSTCKNEQKSIKQTVVIFKKEGDLTIHKIASDSTTIDLDIEIADTEYDTQTGMMYRDSMEDKQGMLFVFEDVKPRSFYMKQTRIPLDIIYANENGLIVSFQKNAQPFNEQSLPSNFPAQYVLEINAGLSDKWNLKEGDSLSYKKLF